MTGIAIKINLTEIQNKTLSVIAASRTQRPDHIERAKIILLSGAHKSNTEIAEELNLARGTVKLWRERWHAREAKLLLIENDEQIIGIAYTRKILEAISDEARPGKPCKFTAKEICKIISLACEQPEDSNLPFTHWSLNSLRIEIKKRGIVEDISRSHLAVFLKSGRRKAA